MGNGVAVAAYLMTGRKSVEGKMNCTILQAFLRQLEGLGHEIGTAGTADSAGTGGAVRPGSSGGTGSAENRAERRP